MGKAILIVGKLCSGKTHYAKRLQETGGAILLSVDELMLDLFGLYAGERHDEYTKKIMKYLLEKSVGIVRGGVDVILDWGFWTKQQRDAVRHFYAQHGVTYEFHYIHVDDECWRARIAKRNRAVLAGEELAYLVDDALMQKFNRLFEAPAKEEIDLLIRD